MEQEKLFVRQAIVVEGKYDRIRLQSVVDALIVETDGFHIFKDKEQLELLRRLAKERGLLILTDSDSAGFVIRNYLNGIIPPEQICHVYVPEIKGKEKRKAAPSKEGLLGVEGIDGGLLREAFRRAGIMVEKKPADDTQQMTKRVTKSDFFEDGLSGGENSSEKRRQFLLKVNLPAKLSANRLLEMINATMSYDEYRKIIEEIETDMRQSSDEK